MSEIVTAMSNKSLDVRAKQRLCYQRVFLPLACMVAVSPHVISAVRRFFEKDKRNVKNNKWFCARRKIHSVVGGLRFIATPRLTSRWTWGETACFIKTYFVKLRVARSGFAHVSSVVRRFVLTKTNRLRYSRFFETDKVLFLEDARFQKLPRFAQMKVAIWNLTNRVGKRARRCALAENRNSSKGKVAALRARESCAKNPAKLLRALAWRQKFSVEMEVEILQGLSRSAFWSKRIENKVGGW